MPGHAAACGPRGTGPLPPGAAAEPSALGLRPSSGSDLKHAIIRTHVRARCEDYLIRTYVHMVMPRVPGIKGRGDAGRWSSHRDGGGPGGDGIAWDIVHPGRSTWSQ